VVEFGGDRVQRAADPVVVEQRGIDTEDLLHRAHACPAGHPDQRRRRGQPVRDQRFDHLSMVQVRYIANRTGPVDDPRQIQTATVIGDHRQRAQLLLDTRRDMPSPVSSILIHNRTPWQSPRSTRSLNQLIGLVCSSPVARCFDL
jgi:hypothetical protein